MFMFLQDMVITPGKFKPKQNTTKNQSLFSI